jgi:guanylate kinase
LIFVVSGPGGVGKGALVARVLDRVDGLVLSRSWTTRPRRPGESPDAYVWVDVPTFEARRAAGGFLEWNRLPANGHLYGTPQPDPGPGRDLLLEIELNGAAQVRARYPDAVLVFVAPPSIEELEARLRGRGDDPASIAARLELGRRELERGPALADHVIVNDDLDRAATELAGIIESRRAGPPGPGRPQPRRPD